VALAPARLCICTLLAFATMSLGGFAYAQMPVQLSDAASVRMGIETAIAEAPTRFVATNVSGVVVAPLDAVQAATAPFGGTLLYPLVQPGSPIRKGDHIAFVKSVAYAEAIAQRDSLQAALKLSAKRVERLETLVEEGLASVDALEAARHDAHSQTIALDARETRLAVVAPGPSPAQYYLTAPITGRITHLRLASGDTFTAGATVASLHNEEAFAAEAQIPSRFADLLELGARVQLNGTPARGRVTAIDPEIDARTRSIQVRVRLPEDGSWRLGQFVDLDFEAEAPTGTVAVPADAVINLAKRHHVFVARDGGFVPLPVTVRVRSRTTMLVEGAIQAGDEVVISGTAGLKNIVEAR